MKATKIGLLGGTFDPVHRGHIQLAAAAQRQYQLDRVLYVPSAHPPHKDGAGVLAFHHRLAMLELVVDRCLFFCSAIEEQLPKPTYTIDMLRALSCRCPPESEFYFIIGSDAFLELPSWKAYRQVLARTNIILARRSGNNNRQLVSFLRRVGYVRRQATWTYPGGGRRLFFLAAVPEEISSSAVRARLRLGEPVADWVPEQVVAYIAAQALYQPKPDKEMPS